MTKKHSIQVNKEMAIDFLHLIVAGSIDEAYDNYVNMHGKHHNMYYSAEFASLKQGMIENHAQFPDKQIIVKNVLGDQDLVAVHSNIVMIPGEPGITVVHIFRFKFGKIVEMWDVGQAIPADSPNKEGAF
jgi:predicted SnoaL-like aldol condensation-catalyzing enzyme